MYDLSDETALRRLTLEGANRFPIWTPDGARITFASNRDGPESIYWRAADGSGVAERLTTPEEGVLHRPESWSPDGRTLSLRVNGGGSQAWALWTLSLDDGEGPQLFHDEPENQFGSVFSPDGNWLAYLSGLPQRDHIYVQPFPATGEIRQVTLQPGAAWPAWSTDGTELFYRRTMSATQYTMVSVSVAVDGGFTFGVERPLPIEEFSTTATIRNFDVMPDGQRFLMTVLANQPDAGEIVSPRINIVENWFEELRQRVPLP